MRARTRQRSVGTEFRAKPQLEILESRRLMAGGMIDYHDEFWLMGDSLSPAAPTTADVISFTLDAGVDPAGGYPKLAFDLQSRVINVIYDYEPWFWGGGPILGMYGQLWDLDAGPWTLRGPNSSIDFHVTGAGPTLPALSISDVTAHEGDSSARNFSFVISLSAASADQVSVDFSTADGSATVAGRDYYARSGTLTFLPGQSKKTVNVRVRGDLRDEYDDTFLVQLFNPLNASIADGHAVGTIMNDDVPPALNTTDVAKLERHSGSRLFTFTVTLVHTSDKPVSVSYATVDATATSADQDYVAATGVLNFAPGEKSKKVTILVVGDKRPELDEMFFVDLRDPVNATLGKHRGVGTIVNDDV